MSLQFTLYSELQMSGAKDPCVFEIFYNIWLSTQCDMNSWKQKNVISETEDHVVQGFTNFLKICKTSQNFGHCKSDVKHLPYW